MSGNKLKSGQKRVYPLQVPGELLELYQPVLGPEAIALWLTLRWLAEREDVPDFTSQLARYTGLTSQELATNCHTLIEAGLIDVLADGTYLINDPLSAEEFTRRFPEGLTVGEKEPGIELDIPQGQDADLDAVINIYQKKVGLLGPVQLDKLRYWVDTKGISAEVVALAINEMVRNAPSPRIQYLEGILRNWYNDGIRTLADWMKQRNKTKGASRSESQRESYDGRPNAQAYQQVQPNLIERWKELYPDECGS
ncbi:MAG: DnaD domain-containing protein [Limnochordia bacterium]|jgi:DnaD/phage-associated family protein